LFKDLYDYVTTAARADKSIETFIFDVKATSQFLHNVREAFLLNQDAATVIDAQAIQNAKRIIDECEKRYLELSTIIKKSRKPEHDGKSRVNLKGKMSWPSKEVRVIELQRRLDSLKSLLLIMLSVLNLAYEQVKG